jgi:hypothetical protein
VNVLLLQLDGKLPNVALMRIAAHHRAAGDHVEFRRVVDVMAARYYLMCRPRPDRVYASLIFQWTKPIAEAILAERPDAIAGGTGWDNPPDEVSSLEAIGITTMEQDYSIYPSFTRGGIGFLKRGCRLRCSFCVVPWKEGRPRAEGTVGGLYRGEGYPRELILLDNDPFGHPSWREGFAEIREGNFKVSFSQGINARFLTEETAEAIASIEYRDDDFTRKRLYTAWDNRKDEERLFAGLNLLVKNGVTPDSIMVYILVGYDHETKSGTPYLTDDDFYRIERLRAFGARPYPMPFVRTPHTIGFQRWVVMGYWKKVPWATWAEANYNPRKLHVREREAISA